MSLVEPIVRVSGPGYQAGFAGNGFFRQERMGKGFRPFSILKFRTMFANTPCGGLQVTPSGDGRITRIGRILRTFKIDELPQLINVLTGEMSLVGPRPEVLRYVQLFPDDFRQILAARPGITDLASIKYRNEAAALAAASDPEQEYVRRILPDKIQLAKEYVNASSLKLDAYLVAKTLFRLPLGWARKE
ncbi:MAG: sugar transferase [Pirellulaceae bacterium]